MSKITFRADDDLVAELEALDASKSEVMREALRTYLESARYSARHSPSEPEHEGSIDSLIRERVDAMLAQRRSDERSRSDSQDINVTVSLEGADGVVARSTAADQTQSTPAADRTASTHRADAAQPSSCNQCGERVASEHVHCPNCGEKASRRLFCECGDEVRTDWAFCPGCGRRTPAADVLES